jgi:hypothetical protein
MPTEERRMTMECKACRCDKGVYGITAYGVCDECQTIAVARFIAAREAEKPKAPTRTLEELVTCELNWGISASVREDEIAERIIAMVREHDFHAKWPDVGPLEFLREENEALKNLKDSQLAAIVDWKARAEKAEVVVVHYRDQIAHRDGKIAVLKSQLEYLQDSIRVARDALNK